MVPIRAANMRLAVAPRDVERIEQFRLASGEGGADVGCADVALARGHQAGSLVLWRAFCSTNSATSLRLYLADRPSLIYRHPVPALRSRSMVRIEQRRSRAY